MRETACQFGPEGHLAGIVTEPAGQGPRVACVLVSAGLTPKFGPYRLYTQLARHLAKEGFLSLRFDLGGIGDSRRPPGAEPLRQRTDKEIGAALDYVATRHRLSGIVLGGLCSGAEDSFRYAERDPRVTGVVMIDPFAYETSGAAWRYLALRTAGRALRLLGIYRPRSYATVQRQVSYKYMEQAESSRILRNLIERRVHSHFVYTGDVRHAFNDPRQLQAMFPGTDFRGLVTVDHFPRTEHTQFLSEDRQDLIEAIVRRLTAAHRSS